eukprot:6964712-Pyramimonas_sp.AAC.1
MARLRWHGTSRLLNGWPSCDWFSRCVYSASPPAIGSMVFGGVGVVAESATAAGGRAGRCSSQSRRPRGARAHGAERGPVIHRVG